MDKSFQIIRTNPRLTTNYKIVVSSDEKLYLESFDSTKELNSDRYKHYLLPIDAILEDALPKFYNGIPKNIAFQPKLNNDADIMYDTYDNQFDNTYYSGSRNIADQWYTEEFEYFAPLYVVKNELPSNFIIMRVDDPVVYAKDGNEYVLGNLNKDNFKDEIIDKWKCVKNFDLSTNTVLGNFLDRNINSNERYPDYSFFFDTKKYNFSKWYGMDYDTGVYTEKEMYLDDYLEYQKLHYELEDFITKGYENNSVIYPYIMNFNFLFDDEPATPDKMNKYSMNRYFGFYADQMEHINVITTYSLKKTKSDLYIKNNVFLIEDGYGVKEYVNPFIDETITSDWILYNNILYEVRQQTNGSYKIIAEQNFSPNEYTLVDIEQTQSAIVNNEIDTDLGIDKYIDTDEHVKTFYADLYLIEIDGIYHVLKNNPENDVDGNTISNNYYIQTDYNIFSNSTILNYWKGGEYSEFSVSKSTLDDSGKPIVYNIYRIKLTDIKDFDFDRVNTKYSDFDYEQSEYVDTLEKKLTAIEYDDNSVPRRKKTTPKNIDGQYKTMNISSEYIAGDELFEVRSNSPSSIWDKSQTICKWGYRGSISHSDYPYKINTLVENGGIYNRTTNTESSSANAIEKNIDYLYRIGELYSGKDYMVNYMDFFGRNKLVNGWDESIGGTYWYINHSIVDGSVVPDESGNLVFFGTSSSSTLEYNIDLEVGETYHVSFTITNLAADGSTGVGIEGVFDSDIMVHDILGYEYSATLTAISDKLILTASNAEATFSNFTIVKVSEHYYYNQTTNIQSKLFNNINPQTYNSRLSLNENDYKFNLGYYIDSDFDYFEYFFSNNMIYTDYNSNKIKPYLKYSIFNSGDSELPAVTSFKGIEYSILGVDEMILENESTTTTTENNIQNIIYNGGSKYNGYKLSTILSETYKYYTYDRETTYITEENILPNGFSAWYSNNGLTLETGAGDTLAYTDYDIVPFNFLNWTYLSTPDNYVDLPNNIQFYSSSDDKINFKIIGTPVTDVYAQSPDNNIVTGIITQGNDLLDDGNEFRYNVEINIEWESTIGGDLSNDNVYTLDIKSPSFIESGTTTPVIDTSITMFNIDGGNFYTYTTFSDSGTLTLSVENVRYADIDNLFNLEYSIKHDTWLGDEDDEEYSWFHNHTNTNVKLNRISVNRIEHKELDGINTNDKVHIIKTDSDTVKTNIIDTQPNLTTLNTIYQQQYSKLDDADTFSYDVNFKFRWGTKFDSNLDIEHFKATFYCNNIFENSSGTPLNKVVVIFDEQGTNSNTHTNTSTVGFSLGFPIFASGSVEKSGIVNIPLSNVTFIPTNNELIFNVEIENTLDGSPNNFTNNVGTYVELIEVTIDRTYPSLEFTNPTLESTENETIVANNKINDNVKYDDINTTLLEKNGLHVIVNEKYKNILIINNKIIPINKEWKTLNNVDFFNNNHGLYYGKIANNENYLLPINQSDIDKLFPPDEYDNLDVNSLNSQQLRQVYDDLGIDDYYIPNKLTAKHYMHSLNNLNDIGVFDEYVHYYVIDEDGNFGKTQMVKWNKESGNPNEPSYSMDSLPNWDNIYPPFIISVNEPNVLPVNKSTYEIIPENGAIDLLKDQYIVYRNDVPLPESIIDEPLARYINRINTDYNNNIIYHNEEVGNTVDIKRFVGYYEPIFHTIPLYSSNYIWKDGVDDDGNINWFDFRGNYKFNTALDQFGFINEIMYSKVNENENVLKLKHEDNYKSIYPMVDEIGLSQTDRFIFLSPWDNIFYQKTTEEIDFLELFKDPKEIKVDRPVTAEISSFKVEEPYYYYTSNGKKLYGNDNSTNQIQFKLNVKNTSSDEQEFLYNIKYTSVYGTNQVVENGSTGIIQPSSTSADILIDANRPNKIDTGVDSYEEYTRWTVSIELFLNGGLIMDNNNSIYFDIYNELVNFEISGYNIADNAGSQTCNDSYTHTISLKDKNVNKLSSIPIELTVVTSSLSQPPATGFYNILTYYNNHNISNTTTLNLSLNTLIGIMTINGEGSGYGTGGYDNEVRNSVVYTKYSYYADYTQHEITHTMASSPYGTYRVYGGTGDYYPFWFGNYNIFDIYSLPNPSGGYRLPRIEFKIWNDEPTYHDVLMVGKLYDGFTGNLISEREDVYPIPENTYNFQEYFEFDFYEGLSGEPIDAILEEQRMYYATLTMKLLPSEEIVETITTHWVAGNPKPWTPPTPTP